MFGVAGGEFLKEFAVIGGLISVQAIYGFCAVFTSHLLSIGVGPLFLIIYGSFTTSIILLPFSISFERKSWPNKITLKLILKLLLISFGGVVFQALMLMGVKKTSPAVASAMPNLAPGFIFLIAWSLGLEKVKPQCIYSKAKIVGTLGCIIGAIAISFFHAPRTTEAPVILATIDTIKIIGSLYLIGGVFVLSCTIVLQAHVMIDFPAPMSLCAVTALTGAIISGILQLIQEHKLDFSWPLVDTRVLIGAALLGGIVGGASTSFSTWVMKKRGPVFVSMFSPIGTVFSVIISCLTIGDSITIGSLLGMLLMFTGLYLCLWAKKNEGQVYMDTDTETTKSYDPEQPLLS
ncbi:WAT1-related protein At5g47470-like [Macadamia integrifolia]|uniref:WAT1-related protein At5g47470-like n=1 Tax=Macadamia integrifolia TaxID=60698 RepID=UPI001C4EEF7F|nr:WAT1-related protein At5g47470-like [Macadamia integrifolia]